MTTGTSIIVTIAFILLIGTTIQFIIWRSNKRDKLSLDKDWMNFIDASTQSDIDLINEYGDKLIWNKHLKQEQLTIISEVVESKIEKNPKLEKLKLNAYNKQLHYDRTLSLIHI